MSACCPIVNRLTEKAPLFAFALILTVSAAQEVLSHKKEFTIAEAKIKETIPHIEKMDNELYNIAKQKSLILITDDVKFSRHISGKVHTQFSTFILAALAVSRRITRQEALNILEHLRDARNWKNNVIYMSSKDQLEKM